MRIQLLHTSVILLLSMILTAAPGLLPFITAAPAFLYGEMPELQNKNPLVSEDDEDDEVEGEVSSISTNISGFVEFENFTSTYPEQEFKDSFKKNELRNNWKIKIGTETFYLNSDTNIYVNDYEGDSRVTRNLTITGAPYEISFNQLFLNYEFSVVRIRVGNQVHAWGTADVFNPTSYFNPMDMREALFRDQDEMKLGVPSLSSLFYIGDSSIEVVYVPVHVPVLIPGTGTFWEIKYEERGYPVTVLDPEALDVSGKNMALGIKFSTNIWSTDFNISAYYGPDVEPIFRPIGTIANIPNTPPAAAVLPEYHINPAFGFSFSRTLGKFVFQGEIAYNPFKTGVIDQNLDNNLPEFPFSVRRYHAVRTSVGINYFIPLNKLFPGHEGETVLTIEWSRPTAFGADDIMEPMIGDTLAIRFDDSYFNDKLKVSMTSVIDPNEASVMLMPEIGYKFSNGISITGSYTWLHGGESSFMGIYTDNDFFKVRVRYEYSL